MQTNVIDFASGKRRFDSTIIYLGDVVEWEDYDGTRHESVVTEIRLGDLQGHSFAGNFKQLPIWEKEEYVIGIGPGCSVTGSAIIRKIVKRAPKAQQAWAQ